jgi:hypothetical protein
MNTAVRVAIFAPERWPRKQALAGVSRCLVDPIPVWRSIDNHDQLTREDIISILDA